MIASLASGPEPLTQQANTLAFTRDREGRLTATDLQKSESTGAVVRRTLREGSGVTNETLTRLPSSFDGRVKVTLLHQASGGQSEDSDDTRLRIALTQKPGVFAKFNRDDSGFAPSIIERVQDTIPTFVASGSVGGLRMIENG